MESRRIPLRIPNTVAGDVTVHFDNANDADVDNAAQVFEALFQNGFPVMIEKTDGSWARATYFDARKNSFKVANGSDVPASDVKQATSAGSTAPGTPRA